MFTGNYEEMTKCDLVAKSGATYTITLVAGALRKHGRDCDGRETEIPCTHGVRIAGDNSSHEWNFVNKREACDYFGRQLAEKLYNGYRFK